MEKTAVTFTAHGDTALRGIFYRPEGAVGVPGIVMAHGFSAVKEMGLLEFAEEFCAAGFAVLVYDHRNLGESAGEPRQEINPWAQARDYRYALSWLAERPEVDADRLAIWGSSFSGGEVIVVAAADERVKAVVANVPLAGIPGVDYSDAHAAFEAIRDGLLDESGAGPADRLGPAASTIRVVDDGEGDEPTIFPQSESREWFLHRGRRPGSTWRNHVTLRNAFDCDPVFDPGACIASLGSKPLLMVVATEDNLAATSIALEAFDRAAEPKRLELIEGHHFDPYEGAGFEQAARAAREFLLEHLKG